MSSGQRSQSPHLSPRANRDTGPGVPLSLAFGRTVRRLREEAGWTQEAFADYCGFFRTYLSRIETGKANPTLYVIDVISKANNLPPSKLLAMAEEHQLKNEIS